MFIMATSNFDRVSDFNKKFGVTTFNEPQPEIFTKEPGLVKLRMDLIREEMKELEEAVAKHDYIETADALADILYVVYGMGNSIGLNMDDIFGKVHLSNMSKLCKSEEEAKDTVAWYEQNKQLGYDSPAYRLSDDGEYWVVFNKSSGKILKSIKYTIVDLKYLINKN